MRILLFTCIWLAAFTGLAQFRVNSNYNLMLDTVNVQRYKTPETGGDFEIMKLEVGFGDFEIINRRDIAKLKNAAVASIELVYTQYPKEEDFKVLNTKRIEYLHLHCPELFRNAAVRWKLVAQHGCTSAACASGMFHGFVIVYRPAPTMESARNDMKTLRETVRGKKPLSDSSLFKILKRNMHKFKKAAIVADFTGSMGPYIAQMLVWYELNFASKLYTEFTFFNDGNATPNESKKAGNTGGIYYCKSSDKDTVLNTAIKCIMNGNGGDLPENNLEAVVYTLKKNPKLTEVIMVADNYATPRDMGMLKSIKVPIRVILCGSKLEVNPVYIEMAYATGGSIHTIEGDIDRLMELQDGKTIKIGGSEFKLSKGKFIPMFKS